MTAPDVLTVRAVLGGNKYPSKNQEGSDNRRDGPKSKVYRALYDLIKNNATAEKIISGWETATCPCLAVVVLYVPDRQYRRDAFNIGTPEANALTAAGIWSDDTLAHDVLKKIVVDPEGPLRVSISVFKLYEPQHAQLLKPKPAKGSRTYADMVPSNGMIKGLTRLDIGGPRRVMPKKKR